MSGAIAPHPILYHAPKQVESGFSSTLPISVCAIRRRLCARKSIRPNGFGFSSRARGKAKNPKLSDRANAAGRSGYEWRKSIWSGAFVPDVWRSTRLKNGLLEPFFSCSELVSSVCSFNTNIQEVSKRQNEQKRRRRHPIVTRVENWSLPMA